MRPYTNPNPLHLLYQIRWLVLPLPRSSAPFRVFRDSNNPASDHARAEHISKAAGRAAARPYALGVERIHNVATLARNMI